jgi:hypothetical protein
MESFFGHFKDLAEYQSLDNIKDVKKEVDCVIEEYNHHYQWGLNKMTPVQYRGHLLSISLLIISCTFRKYRSHVIGLANISFSYLFCLKISMNAW